jgi:hypothetical protein
MFVHEDNTINFAKKIDYKFKIEKIIGKQTSKIDKTTAEGEALTKTAATERETNVVEPTLLTETNRLNNNLDDLDGFQAYANYLANRKKSIDYKSDISMNLNSK